MPQNFRYPGGIGFIVSIGNAGFGHACYGFRPSERDALASTEYVSRIAPHRQSKGRQDSRH